MYSLSIPEYKKNDADAVDGVIDFSQPGSFERSLGS
jgi:hypothetical protein